MKLHTVIVTLSLFLFIGCKGGSEKFTPTSVISEDNFIFPEVELNELLDELYSKMERDGSSTYYGNNFVLIGDVTSDITYSLGFKFHGLDSYTYQENSQNQPIRQFWVAAYRAIRYANILIENVPDLAGIEQEVKDQVLGEIYFLRALAYFDLTRSFGGVTGVAGTTGVYIMGNDGPIPPRLSIEQSYSQVESDLKMAIDLLPFSFSRPANASEASAKALMARLYLYTRHYEKAEQYASEVIDNPSFDLIENYESIFHQGDTRETIFRLNLKHEGPGIWYVPDINWFDEGVAYHKQFVELVKSRPDDKRNQIIGFINVGDDSLYYPLKYEKDDNVQVLRIAEMYLIRAEARVLKDTPDFSGALMDINKIRNRIGLPDTSGTGVDTVSKILNAIELERSIEFMGEGHRWFDLVRTDRALEVLVDMERANGDFVTLQDDYRLVFPLPLGAGEEQNPGY